MFSFHKPKVYRSINGCCICRAKSSSSRFTDSRRYEKDFEMCFVTSEERSGEICNACVLLVKRWKKLPTGSTKNWHHVVDARAGPGSKSILKIKNNNNKVVDDKFKKKHKHKKRVRSLMPRPPPSPSMFDDDSAMGDDFGSDGSSHRSCSPVPSDVSDDETLVSRVHVKPRRRRQSLPRRHNGVSSFLDLNYWKKTEICCGTIYKGLNEEVVLDTSLLRPCGSCKGRPLHSGAALVADKSPFQRQDSTEEDNISAASVTLHHSSLGAALNLSSPEKQAALALRDMEMEL